MVSKAKPRMMEEELSLKTIGIDIGKDIFHIVGFDPSGKLVLRCKFRRLGACHTEWPPNGLSANEAQGACVLPSRPRLRADQRRPDTYQRLPLSIAVFPVAASSRSIHAVLSMPEGRTLVVRAGNEAGGLEESRSMIEVSRFPIAIRAGPPERSCERQITRAA